MGSVTNLKRSIRSGVFWGEIAPTEHCCQIYGDDATIMDALEGFIGSGLRAGDGVIVIATAGHLHALEQRLRGNWLDLDRARWKDRYIALLAQETLGKFMLNGWPDEELFKSTVNGIIARARGNGRKVRVFGEMVALLWAEGNAGATVRLEHLWNELQTDEHFPLFCAYPRSGFTQDAAVSMQMICDTHSKVIPGYI
jgi:MEDS: MEthanogen/methylotroph, DcmR Sensory domain